MQKKTQGISNSRSASQKREEKTPNNKMGINKYYPLIILNINGLSSPAKKTQTAAASKKHTLTSKIDITSG